MHSVHTRRFFCFALTRKRRLTSMDAYLTSRNRRHNANLSQPSVTASPKICFSFCNVHCFLGMRQIHLTVLTLYKVNTVKQNRPLLTHAVLIPRGYVPPSDEQSSKGCKERSKRI